jgi:hypothetical protein
MWKPTIAVVAFLMGAVSLRAQEPAPIVSAIYPENDGLFRPRVALPEAVPPKTISENHLSLDLLLGLPIALRLQHRLGETRASIEGGVALYVVIPSVFAGMRFDAVLHRGENDGISLRPGIDIYYSPIQRVWSVDGNSSGMIAICPDIDFVWRRRVSEHVCGQVSVKVGMGFGASLGGSGSILPVPVIGLSFGLEF